MLYPLLAALAALTTNVVLGAILGSDSLLVIFVSLSVSFWLGKLAGVAMAESRGLEVHP